MALHKQLSHRKGEHPLQNAFAPSWRPGSALHHRPKNAQLVLPDHRLLRCRDRVWDRIDNFVERSRRTAEPGASVGSMSRWVPHRGKKKVETGNRRASLSRNVVNGENLGPGIVDTTVEEMLEHTSDSFSPPQLPRIRFRLEP
jgi:hypothetical protein